MSRWLRFVEQHGIVLASAKGPVPSISEAIVGAPIKGSWWSHPKGKAIFAALTEVSESPDIRCFKLVDGKVTFVHRRLWPALVRLADTIGKDALAAIQQEHSPSGKHVNTVTKFPEWVDAATKRAAAKLTLEEASAQLSMLDVR